jgi:hypothetical protein
MAFSFVFEVTDVAALPVSTDAQRSPGDILFYSKRPGSDNGRTFKPRSSAFNLGIPLESRRDPR